MLVRLFGKRERMALKNWANREASNK